MLAELERAGAPPTPTHGRLGSSASASASDLEERIRRDPPPPGVRRFYNTAFKMPERTHGH